MAISINGNFTAWKLLRFSFPSIIMMMFMALYFIVDGVCISRFVGSNALSSLNIVYPVLYLVMAIASMFASGGNAVISQYMGRGDNQAARECLTLFTAAGIIISALISIAVLCFLEPICRTLGSTDILLKDCRIYLRYSAYFMPALMLQTIFQTYIVTAGHPGYGMFITMAAGIANVILDYLFMAVLRLGIKGAALATGLGESIPTAAGMLYFIFSKKELYFTHFGFRLKEFISACYNGSSEMISQLSGAIVTLLFNLILLELVGEHGVAAITILLYGQFMFNAFYLGFTMGISPIVGFQYGAKNKVQLRHVYKVSMIFVILSSCLVTAVSILAAEPIVAFFTEDIKTYTLAVSGFWIFALNFLFSGINICTSGFFTALSNGIISALISFTRTLGFTVLFLLALPKIWGLTGVWLAIPAAELATFILCIFMHRKYFLKSGRHNYLA